MKIRYYCHCYKDGNPCDSYDLHRVAVLLDAEPIKPEWQEVEWTSALSRENSLKRPFSTYLHSSLSSDFLANHSAHCDFVLQKITQIETGEIEEYMWEGQGFLHYIKTSSVLFEHNIFGECFEWPLWICSLAQYKVAFSVLTYF